MLNACRRGPASICRIAKTTTFFAIVPRTSILSLAAHDISKPAIAFRFLHISAVSRSTTAESFATVEDEPREIGTQADNGALITKFEDLTERGLVHRNVIRQITNVMGHKTMTPVQSMTINETLRGTDVIAQARTGTGKTLGFLVPVIQNIIENNPELADAPRYRERALASDIRGIIISPTRELAEQIAVEAKKLTNNTGVKVQVAVGGSHKSMMLRQMQREGCHLLVATPGRLQDLLTDPYSKVAAPDLKALVLDEADRLLDSGFAEHVEEIIRLLPDRQVMDRQTLLFSATIPKEVMGLVRRTLKPDFQFVQTVDPNEQATHEKVPQKVVNVGGVENLMPALLELCKREIAKANEGGLSFKAIVYFSSTANVELAARIFNNLKSESGALFGKHPLYPAELSYMHGKLTQQARTRVSDRFRRAKSGIMFSSDVTARGMDFPNVSHVIQVGLPPNKDQYIHRVGRTGRGDKAGEGWILLPELEMREARLRLRGLPITADKTLEAAKIDMTRDAQLPAALAATLGQIGSAVKMVDKPTKTAAYMAMLGTMQDIRDKQQVMDSLNQWTRFGWGWETPPPIAPRLAQKLGLSRLQGVHIGHDPEGAPRSSFDGSRGNFGRSGGFGTDREGDFDADRGGYGGERRGRAASDRNRRGGFGVDRDRRGGFGVDRDRRGGFGVDRDRRGGFGGDREGRGRGFERKQQTAPLW